MRAQGRAAAAIVFISFGFNNLNGWGLVLATANAPFNLLGLSPAPVLIVLGVVLGQGARLFLAAIVLDAITGMGTFPAIILLSIIGVVWTWIGGITTVPPASLTRRAV